MLIEDFKMKYTTIPFATHAREHKRNCRKTDIDTLFHLHREVEVLLVREGKARLYCDTAAYELEKGDLALIAPYTPHRYTIFADHDFSHYCLCFDPLLLQEAALQEKLESGVLTLAPVVRSEECAAYIRRAYEANAQKPKSWELLVRGNLALFFAALDAAGAIGKGSRLPQGSDCYRMVDYIARRFAAPVTSADAAEELHWNHSYFCRLFRRNFGYSFGQYLCMYRIEKAKPLLKHTSLSVSEIAGRVGFGSFSYFSKKFKEAMGVTPMEYRKHG